MKKLLIASEKAIKIYDDNFGACFYDEEQGYDLKITEFSDYITPNIAVLQKQLDANFFQTKPYLAQYNKDHHSDLVDLVDVHLEPMGAYADAREVKFIKGKKNTLYLYNNIFFMFLLTAYGLYLHV